MHLLVFRSFIQPALLPVFMMFTIKGKQLNKEKPESKLYELNVLGLSLYFILRRCSAMHAVSLDQEQRSAPWTEAPSVSQGS